MLAPNMRIVLMGLVAVLGGVQGSVEPYPPQEHVLIDRASQQHGWVQAQRAHPERTTKITVGVRVRDPAALERTFFEVSDPANPRYGQHLTFDQVGDLISNEAGVTDITPSLHGELVVARGPVKILETLLHTQFFEYEHSRVRNKRIIAAEHYSMPAELTKHSYGVLGVLPLPMKASRAGSALRGRTSLSEVSKGKSQAQDICSGYVCPSVLQDRYNIPVLSSSASVSIGVFESLEQVWSVSDTTLFFEDVVGENPAPSFPVSCWDSTGCYITESACPNVNNCGEANLDMQIILGLTNGLMDVSYTYESSDMTTWIEEIASESSPSSVYSISYTYSDETEVDSATRTAFDTQAQTLGTQGVSIIVSSGDTGANVASGDQLYCAYVSAWPASSPYVTAVGATQGVESGSEEVACDTGITSGGGFSSLYSVPSYQSSWVESYLEQYSSDLTTGFSSGRGYPDVSMPGYNYLTVIASKYEIEDGTSASAPVFATMIALINDERAKQGLSNLGFLNTFLYTYGTSILSQDITSGSNNCDAEISACCDTGFSAVPGWDPVTGLGSVDYAKLLNQTGTASVSKSSSTSPTTSSRVFRPETEAIVGIVVCLALVVIAIVVLRHRKLRAQSLLRSEANGL